MLHRKFNHVNVPPTTELKPTFDSDTVEEVVEVKNADGKVISSTKVSRPRVFPKLEADLVSSESADFYNVENLSANGIDATLTSPYFTHQLDDYKDSSLVSQLESKD